MKLIKKIFDRMLDGILALFCLLVAFILLQVFCYTSFRIPSDSMEPALQAGDCILVNKMRTGARLFNVWDALEGKQVNIYRMPGWGDFKRNDVLVFNFPYGARWDSIRMDVMLYYVKRCIALPGDTLEIRNGYYKVRGCNEQLGNYEAQRRLAELECPERWGITVKAFPFDSLLNWSIREFGPLPIPRKGQEVAMNRTGYLLYRQLIGWEQKKKLRLEGDRVLLGDSAIAAYQFEKNYYFVSGDRMENSQDSRYWGMLPEEYIVGKAVRIWYSEDKHTGKTRWERVMKKVE